MSDDKDDYNTLYNNLKLEGHVDLSRPGEYPGDDLYTVDPDGNRSEMRELAVKGGIEKKRKEDAGGMAGPAGNTAGKRLNKEGPRKAGNK